MTAMTLAGTLLSEQDINEVSGGDGVCVCAPTLTGCPPNPNGTITACDEACTGSGCSGPGVGAGWNDERINP